MNNFKIKYYDEEIDIFNEVLMVSKTTFTTTLSKIPSNRKIFIKHGYTNLIEVDTEPDINEFKVDRNTGEILFNSAMADEKLIVDYSAIGKLCVSADNVATNVDSNGNVIETLEGFMQKNKEIINSVNTVGDGATVFNQLEAHIESAKNLMGNVIEGGNVNDKLVKTINNSKKADTNLNESINSANIKIEEMNEWVDQHGDIVNLDNRVDGVETHIPKINEQLETIAKVTETELQNNINKYSTIYIDSVIEVNSQILIPSNKIIKFRNNGKIISNILGTENVFKVVGDNVKIYYPNIEYSVSTPSPHAGYGNAIVIGDYRSDVEQKYNNIKIVNPIIVKNNNEHSAIAIYNGCKNIKIINPSIKRSALGILIHWSGDFDESAPHSAPSTVSWHPHNIKIENYKYEGIGKGIHLASCYNVEVNGVEGINASTLIEVGCGDYANKIATPRHKNLVGKQLKIQNVDGYNIKGNAITVSSKGSRGGDINNINILPTYDLTIENVVCEKGNDTSNGSVVVAITNETKGVKLKNINGVGYTSSQIYLSDCKNISIDECDFSENTNNITFFNTDNIKINGCIFNALSYPINMSKVETNKLNSNITLNNCFFNKGLNDVLLYNSQNITINECVFNDYKSFVLQFEGTNKNVTFKHNIINKGTTPNIMSNLQVANVELFKCYGNVFNAMGDVVRFNINVLTTAFKCYIYDNVSYGATTLNSMMVYQGTRSDRSNIIYNNVTFNDFNVGTFTNYYSLDLVEK